MEQNALARLATAPDRDDLQARLIESSLDCIKVLDLEGRLLSMNAGGMAVLEICDLSLFLGASWIDFWHGADRDAARTAVATARTGGIGRFVGFFPTTQTRKPLWFDVVVSAILDAHGAPEMLLAVSRDVTQWKRADEELAHANHELEQRGQELRVLLDVNRAVSRHLERDALFGALAASLRNLLATDRFGVELPIEGNRLQGHLLTPHAAEERPTRVKVLPAEGTACDWVLRQREWIVAASRAELRARFPLTFDVMTAEGMESLCAMPLVSADRARGVLFFMAAARGAYDHLPRALLEQVAGAVAVALDDCLAHEEVRRLRDRLVVENTYLQEEIRSEHNFTEVVGNSPALRAVLRAIEQVAPTDSTALILGETGTGKELVARAIHARSPRRDRPLVKVNCAAISSGLVESELFGHVRGAFTGALDHRDGRFKVADGGTIFLDEVGELPLETQVKLLRVLQEQEFEPVGSSKTLKVNVRVIAATNRDLAGAVRDGRFRSDLFYRLNVFPLQVPPLRERADDVAPLAMLFVQQLAKKFGRPVTQIADETLHRLRAYGWPGNVRELQNVIERAVVLASGSVLTVDAGMLLAGPALPAARVDAPAAMGGPPSASLEEVERRHILTVLAGTRWRIEGERGAAKLLALSPSTLRSRMQKLGIVRPGG